MTVTLPILEEGSPEFAAAIARLASRGADDLEAVAPAVRAILARVRAEGDAGVRACIEAFEQRPAPAELLRTMVDGGGSARQAELCPHPPGFDGAAALARLEPAVREALVFAAERIERYHQHQRLTGFSYEEEGVELGMRVRPLQRVGVYAPGGKARYPSSVLMTAIPARVAGVADIVLATPAPDDRLLAAAHLSGVTSILDAGGAHAVAALAYGTASIRRVDKIVGPGNAYVACAKRLVFGDVDIDGIAGPSEILVLADEGADPALCAADLLSQAEHDEAAHVVLVTTSRAVAEAVAAAVTSQLASLSRPRIIEEALRRHGALLVVKSRARLAELGTAIAAEHVALHVAEASALGEALGAAGCVLVGGATPVAAGDYLAGPSHVLPTGGGARFGSPLGVYDFITRTSVIRYSAEALGRHAPHIVALARAEGLDAHARAVELRTQSGA